MLCTDVPCPSIWLSDETYDMTTCYYVSNNEIDGVASWQEALNKCRQLAGLPDAHLVAITSQSELVRSFLVTPPTHTHMLSEPVRLVLVIVILPSPQLF